MHKDSAARTHATTAAIPPFGISVGEGKVLDYDGAILDPEDAVGTLAADGEIILPRAFDGHVVGDDQEK